MLPVEELFVHCCVLVDDLISTGAVVIPPRPGPAPARPGLLQLPDGPLTTATRRTLRQRLDESRPHPDSHYANTQRRQLGDSETGRGIPRHRAERQLALFSGSRTAAIWRHGSGAPTGGTHAVALI